MPYLEIGLSHKDTAKENMKYKQWDLNKGMHNLNIRSPREAMSNFEIRESCDRLSKPESETGYTVKDHSTYDCKEHHSKSQSERFEGKKKMKPKDIDSVVSRLYGPKSHSTSVTGRRHSLTATPAKGASAWSRHNIIQHSKQPYKDLEENVYRVISGKY